MVRCGAVQVADGCIIEGIEDALGFDLPIEVTETHASATYLGDL